MYNETKGLVNKASNSHKMEAAEFEEKEYEGPLYNQLLNGSHRISMPGQVFESAFGVDAVIEALNPNFWASFGLHGPLQGVNLNDYNFGWIWRRFGKKRDLPTFPVNLLIQAKRPDYLLGPNRDLTWAGISKSYWRFKIRAHQQPLLYKLSRKLRHRALVVYASPAFHRYRELYKCAEAQEIVENSSFVAAKRMQGHKAWNYDRPGTTGVAHSEPVRYEGPDFYSELASLTDKAKPKKAEEELKTILVAIDSTVQELQSNPLSRRYQILSNRLNEFQTDASSHVRAFRHISVFFQLAGVTWFVAGAKAKQR